MFELRSRINAVSVSGLWAASGKWFGKTLRTLREDNRGGTAVLAAIMFPAVIGGFGLGAEAGYWYYTQRKIQHAADVSAHAAGVRKRSGDDAATYEAVALDIATKAQFRYNLGTIDVNSPPATGAYAGNADAVEVILTENLPRLFTAIFANTTVPITSRAVVLIDGGSVACILALGPTESQGVSIGGNSTVTLDGCDIASNSMMPTAYDQGGGPSMTTGCIHTVGEGNVNGGTLNLMDPECPTIDEYAPVTADPYATRAEPTVSGNCQNFNAVVNQGGGQGQGQGQGQGNATQIQPGHYCGMQFSGQSTYNLNAGTYIVDGADFIINSGVTVTGTDVTIYLVNGARININGGAMVDLSAPTSGDYSGILFFAERDDTTQLNHTFSGNASTSLVGAIYTPTDNIDYAGGASGANGCLQAIGWTVEFTGNSDFQSNCANSGTTDIAVNESITVVE
ncbi:MAG TPA: pilus assembly protein TadG-related protein [Afifellaceae bacterium]|nr:pilus assembly protein TadG-related protein [Afifellaceae bacterium]